MSQQTLWPEYGEGYWEHGEGSNYVQYGDDPGWVKTVQVLHRHAPAGPTPFAAETRLLEVACAKGWFVKAADAWGYDAEGIDLSAWAVDHCAPGVDRRIRQGNATDLPWEDDSFDVVCSWEFMEHVPEPVLNRVLDEMLRVLRPGGLFVHRIGTLESDEDRSQHLHDHTHVTNEPRTWWAWKIGARALRHCPEIEHDMDAMFADRDWTGRYFAYALGYDVD